MKTTANEKIMLNNITQLHLIPFDLGCVFFDDFNENNINNWKFCNQFLEELTRRFPDKITSNVETIIEENQNIKYKFINQEKVICYAKISDNLTCSILTNGVGMFLLSDVFGKAIEKEANEFNNLNIALKANFQKKVTQSTLLRNNINIDKNDFLLTNKKEMLNFRKDCWNIVAQIENGKKSKSFRKYFSNICYKEQGLSYVLSIYVFEKNEIDRASLDYLMYSSGFTEAKNKGSWESINTAINTYKENFINDKAEQDVYYSWSGVSVILDSKKNIDINETLKALIKAELFVQSRWFIIDNVLDVINDIETEGSLEDFQRLESYIEIIQAELESNLTANMNTMYIEIQKNVIASSNIKEKCQSVINLIHTQKKIKEARLQDKKGRNRLFANLLLAIFTASSLFKTAQDILKNEFDWKSLVLFLVILAVTILTIVWEYKEK